MKETVVCLPGCAATIQHNTGDIELAAWPDGQEGKETVDCQHLSADRIQHNTEDIELPAWPDGQEGKETVGSVTR